MKTRILLVDDNKKVRSILRSSLENKGLEVVEAVNGLDGLLIAKQQHFDGFLIDHKMPIMDGITLVRDLRELKQYSSSAIILMTTGSCGMLAKSLATCCLEKPVNIDEVFQLFSANSVNEQVA